MAHEPVGNQETSHFPSATRDDNKKLRAAEEKPQRIAWKLAPSWLPPHFYTIIQITKRFDMMFSTQTDV